MTNNYFAQNLRYLRTRKGLEQKDISEMLGLKSPTSVTNWEKGTNLARSGHLNDLANFFGVAMHDLINTDLSSLNDTTESLINDAVSQLNENRKTNVLHFAEQQLELQNNSDDSESYDDDFLLAAHIDDNVTEEEMQEIRDFIQKVKDEHRNS